MTFKKLKILVDMDGVLVDFESRLKERAEYLGFDDVIEEMNKPRKTLKISPSLKRIRGRVQHIISRPGFFYSLKPIDDALLGINRMVAAGHDVFICTSPAGHRSIDEKHQWITDYLGPKWIDRLVITGDKTVVDADYLVDDKPNIVGANKNPSWKRIVFTQPYNQHMKNVLRVDTWNEHWWEYEGVNYWFESDDYDVEESFFPWMTHILPSKGYIVPTIIGSGLYLAWTRRLFF